MFEGFWGRPVRNGSGFGRVHFNVVVRHDMTEVFALFLVKGTFFGAEKEMVFLEARENFFEDVPMLFLSASVD